MKKLIIFISVIALCFSLALPCFAYESNEVNQLVDLATSFKSQCCIIVDYDSFYYLVCLDSSDDSLPLSCDFQDYGGDEYEYFINFSSSYTETIYRVTFVNGSIDSCSEGNSYNYSSDDVYRYGTWGNKPLYYELTSITEPDAPDVPDVPDGVLNSIYQELLIQQNDLLAGIYTLLLVGVGCMGALLVVYVLYRFLKKFI